MSRKSLRCKDFKSVRNYWTIPNMTPKEIHLILRQAKNSAKTSQNRTGVGKSLYHGGNTVRCRLSNRGVISWQMFEFLVILIPNIWKVSWRSQRYQAYSCNFRQWLGNYNGTPRLCRDKARLCRFVVTKRVASWWFSIESVFLWSFASHPRISGGIMSLYPDNPKVVNDDNFPKGHESV